MTAKGALHFVGTGFQQWSGLGAAGVVDPNSHRANIVDQTCEVRADVLEALQIDGQRAMAPGFR